MIKSQQEHWDELARLDPDAVVIDLNDNLGKKNFYIGSIRNNILYKKVSAIRKDVKTLDFGCGSGLTTEYFLNNGINATGIDVSYSLLSRASKRSQKMNLPVLQYDGFNLPFYEETFDAVTTYVVLNHITNDDHLKRILSEIRRVLKKNGKLIVLEQTRRKAKLYKDGSKKQRTINEYSNIFCSSGYDVQEVDVVRFGHFPLIYLIRYGLLGRYAYKFVARTESLLGRFYKVPVFDYVDTLFVVEKR